MFKVLLLEDEEIIGKIYKKNFEAHNFDIRWTRSVGETKSVIENFSPDIFLIDQGIQGENTAGLDIIPELKKRFPKSFIYMLSNYSDSTLEKKAQQSGAQGFLVKLNYPPKMLIQFLSLLKK